MPPMLISRRRFLSTTGLAALALTRAPAFAAELFGREQDDLWATAGDHSSADQGAGLSRARRPDHRAWRARVTAPPTAPARVPRGDRRLPRRGRRPRRRPRGPLPHRGRSGCGRTSTCTSTRGRRIAFSTEASALSAAGAHALRRHRADELFAVHLRARRDQRRASPAAGRSTARPTRSTGGRGARTRSPARNRLIDMAAKASCRSPSACSATARRSCARTSSSPTGATNVLIEGVTIINSPMWELNPVLCTNVIVRGVNDQQPRPQQRRLRSRVVPRRADRALLRSTPATTASRSSRAATTTAGGCTRRSRT